MISHFHYDPVWWNTQAAYTSLWTEEPPGRCRQTNGFNLVAAHLEMARREPEYKFVLAEVDYLKPYWDTHPQDRADLRRFIAEGRVEIMGGTYNEPNTNLTSPETTIRNFVAGIGFQRDVVGAEPGDRVAAGRVRPRPPVPGNGGRRRADVQLVGARPAPSVGPDAEPGRPRAHAVLQRVRVDLPVGPRAAHPLHARALLGGLVDGFRGDPRRGRNRDARTVLVAEEGRADAQRAAAGRHRLHAAEQVGHRDSPRLERALHLAAVRVRAAAGVLRLGAGRTGRARDRGRRRRPAT